MLPTAVCPSLCRLSLPLSSVPPTVVCALDDGCVFSRASCRPVGGCVSRNVPPSLCGRLRAVWKRAHTQCCVFHPNGGYVFTGSADRTVRMWEVGSGGCVRLFHQGDRAYGSPCAGGVSALAVSPSGTLLAAGSIVHSFVWLFGCWLFVGCCLLVGSFPFLLSSFFLSSFFLFFILH